jgi:anti-anti-sigma regulatory factor
MSNSLAAPLRLPSELTIYTASETRQAWLAWLAAEQAGPDDPALDQKLYPIDAAAVDQVDAAGVQLLVALATSLSQQRRWLQLLAPSAPLQQACAALGAAALFDAKPLAEGADEAEGDNA